MAMRPIIDCAMEALRLPPAWRNRNGGKWEEGRWVSFPLSFARCCRLRLWRRRVNPAIDCPAILLTARDAPTSRRKDKNSRKATPARSRPRRAVHLRKARKGNHPPACRQLPKDPPRQSLILLRSGVDQRVVPASGGSNQCLEGGEEWEGGAEDPEPLVEPVRVEPMLRTGDLDARAVMFAGEVGRPGDKLFADTLPAMMRRDDKAGDSANR